MNSLLLDPINMWVKVVRSRFLTTPLYPSTIDMELIERLLSFSRPDSGFLHLSHNCHYRSSTIGVLEGHVTSLLSFIQLSDVWYTIHINVFICGPEALVSPAQGSVRTGEVTSGVSRPRTSLVRLLPERTTCPLFSFEIHPQE